MCTFLTDYECLFVFLTDEESSVGVQLAEQPRRHTAHRVAAVHRDDTVSAHPDDTGHTRVTRVMTRETNVRHTTDDIMQAEEYVIKWISEPSSFSNIRCVYFISA